MAPNNPLSNADLPDPTDPSAVVNAAEPEVVEGPLGVPIVQPKGGPDLPGTSNRY